MDDLDEFANNLRLDRVVPEKDAVARPFLKWVGGKTKLIPFLLDIFPKNVKRYYEPFIGGGAVFWHMSASGRFETATLNDWNVELVNTYKVVRDFPDELLKELARYPSVTLPTLTLTPIDWAARFIFLNKAGFNGLYRLNQKGKFNVPWGKNPDVQIYSESLIRACSAALNQFVTLSQGDFVSAVSKATEGDLVYLDPPYVPVSDTASFTGYTKEGFGLDDQYRVAALFKQLQEQGAAVVVSNSDTPEVRGMFEGYEMHQVPMRRNINSKGDSRGAVSELVIVSRKA